MQAGLVVGHIGEAKYIIQRIKEHFNCPNMKVIATGGLGKVIYEEEKGIFDVYDPVLSLHGLRLIYGRIKTNGNTGESTTGFFVRYLGGKQMLLVIDVGNTNFVLGLYKKEKIGKVLENDNRQAPHSR